MMGGPVSIKAKYLIHDVPVVGALYEEVTRHFLCYSRLP